jgi:hypothetical protein
MEDDYGIVWVVSEKFIEILILNLQNQKIINNNWLILIPLVNYN